MSDLSSEVMHGGMCLVFTASWDIGGKGKDGSGLWTEVLKKASVRRHTQKHTHTDPGKRNVRKEREGD